MRDRAARKKHSRPGLFWITLAAAAVGFCAALWPRPAAAKGRGAERQYYTDIQQRRTGEFCVYTGGRRLFKVSLVVGRQDFAKVGQGSARIEKTSFGEGRARFVGQIDIFPHVPSALTFTQEINEMSKGVVFLRYTLEFSNPVTIENLALLLEMDPESFEKGTISTDQKPFVNSRFPVSSQSDAFFFAYHKNFKFVSNRGESIYLDASRPLRVVAFDRRSVDRGYPVRLLLPVPILLGKVVPGKKTEFCFILKLPGQFTIKRVDLARGFEHARPQPYVVSMTESPVNFQDFLEKPAGLHGKIVAERRSLVFASNSPARFFGVEVSGPMCAPAPEASAQTAAFLASLGVNLVWMTDLDAVFRLQADESGGATRRFLNFAYELRSRGIYLSLEAPKPELDDVRRSADLIAGLLSAKCAADGKALNESGAVVFVSVSAPETSAAISAAEGPARPAGAIEAMEKLVKRLKAANPDVLIAGPAKIRDIRRLKCTKPCDAVLQTIRWPEASNSLLTSDPRRLSPPSWIAYAGVRDKPLILAFSPSNGRFSAEQAVWTTAVASLQDACAVVLRGFLTNGKTSNWRQPAVFAQLPVLAASFQRMDLPANDSVVAVYYSDDQLALAEAGEPLAAAAAESATLVTVLGGQRPKGKFLRPDGRLARDTNPVISENGCFTRMPAEGVLMIKTPCWEAAVGSLNAKPRWEGKSVVFEGKGYSSIMVMSLTDDAIAKADDIILTAVGLSGRLEDGRRGVIPVRGAVRIKSERPMSVWAITSTGEEIDVEASYVKGRVVFSLLEKKPVLHYLLSSSE